MTEWTPKSPTPPNTKIEVPAIVAKEDVEQMLGWATFGSPLDTFEATKIKRPNK